MTVSAGDQVGGRYKVTSLVARGAMGEVWRAHDHWLDRDVAVKLMHGEYVADAAFRRRFDREAKSAARLNHPNIAAVHDYGEMPVGGQTIAYLVMELVEGQTLADRLGRLGRMGVEETLRVLGQAADALAAAHRIGIVHRDVKPANLLLGPDGVVKLTDFGIAQARDAAALTGAGTVIGTVHYMAPEQVQGREVTAAADVYALGVVGYECLTGTRPFDGTREQVAAAQLHRDPPPLPVAVPEAVRALLRRALGKNPADRYRDGKAFAEAVRQITSAQAADDEDAVDPIDERTVAAAAAGPVAARRTDTKVLPRAAKSAAPWTPRQRQLLLHQFDETFIVDPALGPARRALTRLAARLLPRFPLPVAVLLAIAAGGALLWWLAERAPVGIFLTLVCGLPLLTWAACLTVRRRWVSILPIFIDYSGAPAYIDRTGSVHHDQIRAGLL